MSEPERPFLPMSWELGGDFMSGMADSIRERRAREVPEPEREEGVDEEKEIRSMIASLKTTIIVLLVVTIASIVGAVSSAEIHWLLVLEFGITAGVGIGAGLTLLVIYQELRQFRR
jgi:hypothetical protein